MPLTAGIYGFDHMVVRMEEFDTAVAAYSKLFTPSKIRPVGDNPSMGLKMAFFDIPNGGFIEVVTPTAPDSVIRKALDKSGPGMHMMAFQCHDLAATVAMMKRNGVKVIDNDPNRIMIHPQSTHGILMQLTEKPADASRATKAGQVPDTSGLMGKIVSYKCTVVFVADIEAAVKSYEKLGLKLHFKAPNKKGGIVQAGFFLKGGGMIELIGPIDPSDKENGFVKYIAKRGEGFKHLSLDGSAGCVDALNAAGVRTRETDPEHSDIHHEATLTAEQLLQLNPVGMGSKEQVNLGGKKQVAKL